jgi:hypothetical protein
MIMKVGTKLTPMVRREMAWLTLRRGETSTA